MSHLQDCIRRAITIPRLQKMYKAGEPIAMLTCYDAIFAALLERAGIDVLLIGDSLGNVLQGQSTTLPVRVADIVYHTISVARGINNTALVISDLPFGSYGTPLDAYSNAVQLMQAGAQMVKLEGGAWLAETIHFLVERSVPVCGHLGLTPQSVHAFGGFKVQGKNDLAAEQLKKDAQLIEKAGARLLVLEAIPAALGAQVTRMLTIPTIGIGAGIDCSGQVLVLHDMLGIFPANPPRFVKNFMVGQPSIEAAVRAYVHAVKERMFPSAEHVF
ncbi:3-methyl-2-oxobutanoate hydroxymethyltransferase [Candidatus Vallotia cooleyia]|uniref:3-methyl-2-oxobutanoate hydroxymethyltransferase n=1 Tax=Candidatus Vallotiella adelgis TaxID=1177211 RepID=UPI001D027DA8|nr:3-methyl-2-oxobutanoate hydroxymethyltransferase [Candidatus Vallotia cooleyia]